MGKSSKALFVANHKADQKDILNFQRLMPSLGASMPINPSWAVSTAVHKSAVPCHHSDRIQGLVGRDLLGILLRIASYGRSHRLSGLSCDRQAMPRPWRLLSAARCSGRRHGFSPAGKHGHTYPRSKLQPFKPSPPPSPAVALGPRWASTRPLEGNPTILRLEQPVWLMSLKPDYWLFPR